MKKALEEYLVVVELQVLRWMMGKKDGQKVK